MQSITGMESRKGLENAIISNGKIVNVVSKSYGHVPNRLFFKKAEQMLTDAGLDFHRRTVNRDDRSFVTDFIIDGRDQFSVRNGKDKILPMLRFKNSYDGSEKASGHFGFYRMICSNGLHVADTEIQFSIRHTRNNTDLIMPGIRNLFDRFLDNEYYAITGKFERMMKVELIDTKAFVKEVLRKSKIFRYECSDKNPDPSKKAREVLEILDNEAILLNEEPNLWLGYNAFNRVLHTTLKKGFSKQEELDRKLFDLVYGMV